MGKTQQQNRHKIVAGERPAIPTPNEIPAATSSCAAPPLAHLTHMLVRSFFDETMEYANFNQACSIFTNCGRIAGEEFAFCYLDLQDTPDQFFAKFTQLQIAAGFPAWQIHHKGQGRPTHVYFQPTWSCHGHLCKKATLMCEYMGGFVLGLLDAYTNQPHILIKTCPEAVCSTGNSHCCQCCMQAIPGRPHKA